MNRDCEAGEHAGAHFMRSQARPPGCVRVGWVLLLFALMLPALSAQIQPRVMRDGNGWVQEIAGTLGGEKSLQVTRFVGSVQVVVGARPTSYLLRLHSEEFLEEDARKQFAGYHLGVGRRNGEDLIQAVGPIDLAVRAELILHLPLGTESVHVDTLAGKITIQGDVDHLDLQTHGGDIELDGRSCCAP